METDTLVALAKYHTAAICRKSLLRGFELDDAECDLQSTLWIRSQALIHHSNVENWMVKTIWAEIKKRHSRNPNKRVSFLDPSFPILSRESTPVDDLIMGENLELFHRRQRQATSLLKRARRQGVPEYKLARMRRSYQRELKALFAH